jgi:O-antigen/teichoic acid export membrane protein
VSDKEERGETKLQSVPFVDRLLSFGTSEGLRERLIRGAMGVGGLKVLSLLIGFLASVLLARILGPEGFGQYTFIMSVATVLSLPFNQGLKLLITREIAGYHHEAKWSLFRGLLRRSHQWVLLGALMVAIGLGVWAGSRANWDPNDRWTLLLISITIFPFLGLNAVRSATLRGMSHVVQAQLPELLVRPAFHLTVAALLFLSGILNPSTALFSQAIAIAIAFMVGTVLLRRRLPLEVWVAEPDYRSIKWMYALGPFALLVAASTFNNQIGILFLGWLGTDEQVAALRIAERGATLVALPLTIVNLVISPYITRTHRDKNWDRLQKLSRQSARAALLGAIPIALPLIIAGAPLITLVFGQDYVELTVLPLAVLAVAQVVNVAIGSVGMYLAMSGFERDVLLGHATALSINAGAAFFLIPQFGADGAAYAAATGLVVWNVILGVKFMRRLNIRPGAF